jgi:hypothetical protein
MASDSLYHDGRRRLQDARETRRLADRLEAVTVRTTFTDEDRTFIRGSSMFFVATADARGYPDCSYKGGLPGFVRVLDDRTLCIPDYDGNGITAPGAMCSSMPTSDCCSWTSSARSGLPRPNYTPPVPAWKTFADFRDSLPARDRAEDD